MNILEKQPPTCYNLNMNVLISVGILILAMLIMAFLQITPGVFALSYHYAIGKYSKKKASRLMLFFIIGVEIITACVLLSVYYLISILCFGNFQPETSILTWIMIGILFAFSILSAFYYYRRGNSTKLYIPRKFARALDSSAKSIKTNSDAFVLGVISIACELLFILPLFIVSAIELMRLDLHSIPINLLAILLTLAPLFPLFIIHYKFQAGYNLANILKSRSKNKSFNRVILSLSYLIIAVLIICFKVNLQ